MTPQGCLDVGGRRYMHVTDVLRAVRQSCSANAAIGGNNFTAFAANEGLFLQPANGGKFEWRVGGDAQTTSGSVGNS